MLVIKPAVPTDGGVYLQFRNIIGDRIEFTKFEVGSGQYSDEEATEEALRKRTSLKSKKQQFGISSMKVADDGVTFIFSIMITNADLSEGYTIRELGLYAQVKDQPDTECLVSISLAEIEDDFPAYDGKESRILMRYQFSISNTESISLSYEHHPVALVEYVDLKDNELDVKIQHLQKLFPELRIPNEKDKGKVVQIDADGNAIWGSSYIVFPTFSMDFSTGHLSATGGAGVDFRINENGHLESEVL